MTFSGRILRSCAATVAVLIALAILHPGLSSAAGSSPGQPVPKDPLVASAIGALESERNLLEEQRSAGQTASVTLRSKIRAADDHGVRLLEQLRQARYSISPALEETLGPLPAPEANTGPVRPPGPQVYQRAIDELETATPLAAPIAAGTATGQNATGQNTTGQTPAATADPAAADDESGSLSVMNLLVVAVVVLGAVVILLVVLIGRRGKDTHLAQLALRDSLTGLANRRRLDGDLVACRSDRRTRVAVMMVDVDNFKIINDTHGHAAGDRILQALGALLASEVRSKDVVYRYGGEEFCVLLPDSTEAEAMQVAERIRMATAALSVPVGGMVTVSVGVAVGSGADVVHTLGLADAALYEAKRDGRNRIVLAAPAAGQVAGGQPVNARAVGARTVSAKSGPDDVRAAS